MIHSFRLRLALLLSVLSGVALAAFGAGTWVLVRNLRTDRTDSDLRSNAEREVSRTRDTTEWKHIEGNLVSSMGVRDASDLLLLVEDQSGRIVYQTTGWPAGLASSSLPWPAAAPRRTSPQSVQRPPAATNEMPWPQPPGPPPVSEVIARTVDGRRWRIGLASTDTARIAIAVDEQTIDTEMNGIRDAYILTLPLALTLIGFGAWVFSGRALQPLQKLTAATQRVTAEALDQRIASQGEDYEFVALIELFNGMLERLERSFQQTRRFSADAAHELKTPLAILQGQVERAIHAADSGSPMQIELTGILDEVRHLSAITNKLLLLAQADAGHLKVHREPFDLSKALTDLVEDTRMLAPYLQVSCEFETELLIQADGSLLQQVLHNFISNAIKYNVKDGWIRIAAAFVPEGVEVRIANSSAGIPEAERARIFERFYRADPAHGHNAGGAGLGLSVSREIVRAHGGEITLKTDDGVVEFGMFLPS